MRDLQGAKSFVKEIYERLGEGGKRKMMNKLREKLAKFMYGRYGSDSKLKYVFAGDIAGMCGNQSFFAKRLFQHAVKFLGSYF